MIALFALAGAGLGVGLDAAAARAAHGPRTRSSATLAALAGALLWAWGATQWAGLNLLPWLAFLSALLYLADVDLRALFLPNIVTLPLAALGLVYQAGRGEAANGLAGLLVAALLLAVVAAAASWRYKAEAFGIGDIKLGAALGAWLGYPETLWALAYGFVAGGLIAGVLITAKLARGERDWQTAVMPFGPPLMLGVLPVLAGFVP